MFETVRMERGLVGEAEDDYREACMHITEHAMRVQHLLPC